MLGQKKLVLFPEIGQVNFFYHSPAHIVERVSEYIFLIVKEKYKSKRQNAKETKKEKRISVENLTMISLANFASVLLTYFIESWISSGCSYQFNVLYVQREKSQYLLYYKNIWSTRSCVFFKSVLISPRKNTGPVTRDDVKSSQIRNETPLQF